MDACYDALGAGKVAYRYLYTVCVQTGANKATRWGRAAGRNPFVGDEVFVASDKKAKASAASATKVIIRIRSIFGPKNFVFERHEYSPL